MAISARQVEIFRAMMECGTVTAAAKKMRVSQPAASRMLERFQDEVGFVAFERVGGKLKPTAQAFAFYDEVRRVYQGLGHLDKIAKELRENRRGQIRIGVIPALSNAWIAERVNAFLGDHPNVFVTIVPAISRDMVETMVGQRLDIGFSALPSDDTSVDCRLLFSLDGVCIFPKGHELHEREVVRLHDLTQVPFISLSAIDDSRTRVDQLFDVKSLKRKVAMELAQASTVCHMVARGIGASIVSRFTAQEYAWLGFETRDIEPSPVFPNYLLRSRLQPQSAIVDSFVEFLEPRSRGTRRKR